MKRDSQGRTLAQWRKAVRSCCRDAKLSGSYSEKEPLHLLPEKYQPAVVRYNSLAQIGRYYGVYFLTIQGQAVESAAGSLGGDLIKRRAPVWATSEETFLERLMLWCQREGISIPALPAKRRGSDDA